MFSIGAIRPWGLPVEGGNQGSRGGCGDRRREFSVQKDAPIRLAATPLALPPATVLGRSPARTRERREEKAWTLQRQRNSCLLLQPLLSRSGSSTKAGRRVRRETIRTVPRS